MLMALLHTFGRMCFWSPKPTHKSLSDEDEDVAAERERITSGKGKDDILRLENLTKVSSDLKSLTRFRHIVNF